MLFSSAIFLFAFLPVVVLVYYPAAKALCRSTKYLSDSSQPAVLRMGRAAICVCYAVGYCAELVLCTQD